VTTARHDDTADDKAVPTLPESMDAFFVARRPRKDSPHTATAYANDLRAIGELLARAANTPLDQLTVDDLTVPRLRSAFAEYADGHAKASINRCWSTWNQLFTFLVAEGHRDGNPMPAIAKAKLPRRLPKPLTGEDTPEQLLQAAAAGRRRARNPWPERDLAVLATLLLCGLRSAELLDLRVDSLAGRPGERRLHVLGKGGRARSVPIEPPLQAVLDAYLASRRARFPHQRLGRRAALFLDTRGEPLQCGGLLHRLPEVDDQATGHTPALRNPPMATRSYRFRSGRRDSRSSRETCRWSSSHSSRPSTWRRALTFGGERCADHCSAHAGLRRGPGRGPSLLS